MSSYLPKFLIETVSFALQTDKVNMYILRRQQKFGKFSQFYLMKFFQIFVSFLEYLNFRRNFLTLRFSLNFCFWICNCHYIDKIVFFESSCCTHPKVMTNMLQKVFNWSEVHLSEVTSYKIHTLVCKLSTLWGKGVKIG